MAQKVVVYQNQNKMKTSFQDIIQSDSLILVDFYATWCGPCQMLAPILKQVKDNLGDRVTVLKIDVDKNQEIATLFQVRGVPTLLLFRKGKVLWRQSGLQSKEALVSILLEHSI